MTDEHKKSIQIVLKINLEVEAIKINPDDPREENAMKVFPPCKENSRIRQMMCRKGIRKMKDFEKFTKRDIRIDNVPGLGEMSMNLIKTKMEQHGVKFKDEEY